MVFRYPVLARTGRQWLNGPIINGLHFHRMSGQNRQPVRDPIERATCAFWSHTPYLVTTMIDSWNTRTGRFSRRCKSFLSRPNRLSLNLKNAFEQDQMGAILVHSFINPSSIECFEAFLAVGIKLTPIGIDNPLSIEMGREILPLFLRLWWHLPIRKFLLSSPIFDSYGPGKSKKKKRFGIW